jgi:hypothetical protein
LGDGDGDGVAEVGGVSTTSGDGDPDGLLVVVGRTE